MSLKRHTFEAFPAHLTVSSPEETRSAGSAFAPHLNDGDVVAIEGKLGSGKTTFVQGIIAARSGTELATSPTFTFWHHYPGVEHLDLYRVENDADLADLGLEDAFGPHSVTVVEWPERAPALVGRPAWRVRVRGSGDESRRIEIERG